VEFFASAAIVEKLEKAVAGVNGVVDFLAGNSAGELKTSIQAVTWDVFPGQEIIQSTIIEHESFLTWKEEAFQFGLIGRYNFLQTRRNDSYRKGLGIPAGWSTSHTTTLGTPKRCGVSCLKTLPWTMRA